MPDGLKVGFEATGGQEWALWPVLIRVEVTAVQLSPAQIWACRKQGVEIKLEEIDNSLKEFLES